MPNENETAVRRLLDDWARGVRSRDVARATSHYASDVRTYDIAPPLEQRAAEIRTGLADWFATFDGPIGWEVRDLLVVADENVAFSRSLVHLTGARTSREKTDVWLRATVGLRKSDGVWRIVHEHTSVPMYMDGSNRSAIDLKP